MAVKRPLLTRSDVIVVLAISAGFITPLTVLALKPSGWLLLFDVIVSASLGLLIAVVVAFGVRFLTRWRSR